MALGAEFQQAAADRKEAQDRRDFFAAVMQNAQKTVAQIATEYPDAIHWVGEDEASGIHVAACSNRIEMIDFFLSRGVDINLAQQNENKYTPLTCALIMQKSEVVQHLIAKGADVTVRDGRSPLVLAAAYNLPQALSGILNSRGVDIDEKDKTGKTALIAAAAAGYTPIVDYLIYRGASLDVTDNTGKDAAALAEEKGHLHIADRILEEIHRRANAVIQSMTSGSMYDVTVKGPLRLKSASTGNMNAP